MLIRLMDRRSISKGRMAQLGISTLLIGLGVVTLGTRMNRMLDSGSTSFLGVPLSEFLSCAILGFGCVLLGASIVLNVLGARSRC